MYSRIEGESTATLGAAAAQLQGTAAPYLAIPDGELETPILPRDHPAWMRDAVALSARARAALERIKPVVIQVLNFWDHVTRSITVAGRNLRVDASGSYRIE